MNFCKTEEFHIDLIKLLKDESKKAKEYASRHAKEQHYEAAWKYQLDASTFDFMLREITHYKQEGRWL